MKLAISQHALGKFIMTWVPRSPPMGSSLRYTVNEVCVSNKMFVLENILIDKFSNESALYNLLHSLSGNSVQHRLTVWLEQPQVRLQEV